MDKKMIPIMLVMMILMIAGIVFAAQGMQMHKQVNAEEARFHALQDQYFTLNKSVRDSADTGSDLNAQLVEIKNSPSNLLRLKLIGVGKILTGIFILLFGILIALIMMPIRLKELLQQSG